MTTSMKIVIVAALAVAVAGAVVLKQGKATGESQTETAAAHPSGLEAGTVTNAPPAAATAKLPRMVDLGAGKCIPCKMMKPILEELKRDYANQFVTEFIDVWENPDAGKKYGIEMIPTQIFYDAEGQERFRHVGFYSKEDILGTWEKLGVKVKDGTAAEAVR
jgi:thioredoxin 1